ncbi:hypothetical protein M422DRAFT_223801 [Sphaerobolus stellatus SS14]|nr:hypothetical protein M422DRAFT_223801 [Sphaerobolus stellatus SS14]
MFSSLLNKFSKSKSPETAPQTNSTPVSSNDMSASGTKELATFANGCFWGTEHIFLKHYPIKENKGILSSKVGFIGGKVPDPSYQLVCTGETEHAEAIELEFDPAIVKYEELVEFFYRTHDPTTVDRQGNDVGSQYRSAIFVHSDEQAKIAREVTEAVQKKHFDPKGAKIVTTIEAAGKFYTAEQYHQLYLFKNPNGYHCYTHRLHW